MASHRAYFPNLFALAGGLALFACSTSQAPVQHPSSPPPAPSAAAEAKAPEEPGVVRYFSRRVDLKPFLAGFPYRAFVSQLDDGQLFYLDAREQYRLLSLPIAKDTVQLALDQGTQVTDADFSQRSLWNVHYVKARSELWLHADEHNDERMNLFRLDLTKPGSAPIAETDHDYIYDFGFSEDDELIAYLPRKGKQAPFETCLNVLDLKASREGGARKERVVVCDTPELRFTWGKLTFSPDKRDVYFTAQANDDRNRVQLVRVRLTDKQPKVVLVTDPAKTRTANDVLDGWASGERLFFIANDDGYRNLYVHTRKDGKVRQLTHYTEDVEDAQLAPGGVFLSHGTPAATTIELVDLARGNTLASRSLKGKVHTLDASGDVALYYEEAPDELFALNAQTLTTDKGTFTTAPRALARPAPTLEEAVVQCQAEAVRFPTFDVDPKTGKPRELHAFLLTPKRPLAANDGAPRGLAMVRSFYGGENVYNQFDHIMCAAGITLLSPSVRGSDGFGKEFQALNDGDLGGDEIVDLFYAARWLAQRTGLTAEQIGVYGRSHGGYATMRALTYPKDTNGRNESYPFGFGLADAGFCDIEAFWRATNIPDWVVLEAGDPAKPEGLTKVRDRSPIHHVDLLRAPLFLLHGENDWRVPVQGSRAFAEAAQAAHKPVTYVEVKGQGHRVEGLERIAQTFQSRFDFLMGVARR